MSKVKLHPSWKQVLSAEFESEYWRELTEYVRGQYATSTVYPPAKNIFRALDMCPFNKVKVVILGQDPYHGRNQANGLSFAVADGVAIPPSLKNIFTEIQNDLGIKPNKSGDLSRWAEQGVLMLNSVLTVAAGSPGSHRGKGWERFTDAVIQSLNAHKTNVVYMLWGKYAQEKGNVIDAKNNLVLTSAHPSPYSVTGFYGNNHFSQCNTYLQLCGEEAIDWR